MIFALLCQMHWLIRIFKSDFILSICTALQLWVMVAKDISPLQPWLTVAKRLVPWNLSIKSTFFMKLSKSGVQNAIFMGKSHEISFIATVSQVTKGKYPLQPWLMVAKNTFPFETVTDSCKEANFIGFSKYIYEKELSSENMYLPMYLQKRAYFISHYSK